mmetsp:Transcript_17833/g.45690  ORF Transcript_17833/g.45690 Transcript_17833/m.45690 type:complete len:291 (-) Transcript_17833:1237-2109(-)
MAGLHIFGIRPVDAKVVLRQVREQATPELQSAPGQLASAGVAALRETAACDGNGGPDANDLRDDSCQNHSGKVCRPAELDKKDQIAGNPCRLNGVLVVCTVHWEPGEGWSGRDPDHRHVHKHDNADQRWRREQSGIGPKPTNHSAQKGTSHSQEPLFQRGFRITLQCDDEGDALPSGKAARENEVPVRRPQEAKPVQEGHTHQHTDKVSSSRAPPRPRRAVYAGRSEVRLAAQREGAPPPAPQVVRDGSPAVPGAAGLVHHQQGLCHRELEMSRCNEADDARCQGICVER